MTSNKNTKNKKNKNNKIITLNAYGNEDLSHISDKNYIEIFKKGSDSICAFVDMIHFNTNKPENNNIYIENLEDDTIYVYNGNEWELRDQNETLDEIIHNVTNILMKKY